MTELAKCRCGAEAELRGALNSAGSGFRVSCPACMLGGPWRPTEPEAIAAWNSLMRPRPVAEWDESTVSEDLFVGDVSLGGVHVDDEGGTWCAVCLLDGEVFTAHDATSARAWLEERVTDAELLGYADIHCETERALFHVDHLRRLFALAGESDPGLPATGFLSCGPGLIRPLTAAARERLAPAPGTK